MFLLEWKFWFYTNGHFEKNWDSPLEYGFFCSPFLTIHILPPKNENYIQYLPKKMKNTTNVLMNEIFFGSSIIMYVPKVWKFI